MPRQNELLVSLQTHTYYQSPNVPTPRLMFPSSHAFTVSQYIRNFTLTTARFTLPCDWPTLV